MWPVIAALLALACSTGPPLGDSGTPTTSDSIDWSAPALSPQLGLDDLDGAAVQVMSAGLVHPREIHSLFSSLFDDLVVDLSDDPSDDLPEQAPSGGAADCPGPMNPSDFQEGAVTSEWFGTCSGSAVQVQGGWLVTLVEGEERTEVNALYSLQGSWLDSGQPLHMGGVLNGSFGSGGTVNASVQGSFTDGADPGALGQAVSVGQAWSGSLEDGVLTGKFDARLGADGGGLVLTGFTVDPDCGPGPVGTVALRDGSGGWWEIVLADDCSGCGMASFAGEEQGDSCVGLTVQQALTERFAAWVDT